MCHSRFICHPPDPTVADPHIYNCAKSHPVFSSATISAATINQVLQQSIPD
eukprot:m.32602 g.32602  ORF g.32602 m.32602 type:complete len:51 (+) comp7062_c0_seq2:1194-1346(+)